PRERAPVKILGDARAGGGNTHAEFARTADGKTGKATATAKIGNAEAVVRKSMLTDRSEAHLLFEELELFNHDRLFEKSVHAAANMLVPNYRRERVKGSLLVLRLFMLLSNQ